MENDNYKAPTFTEVPKKEELQQLFEKFEGKNGNNKWKVGIVKKDKVYSRYTEDEKYKKLEKFNIFCYAMFDVASEIEKLMKKILVEVDKCANNRYDSTAFVNTGEIIVYLVELKSDLFICPHTKCFYTSTHDFVKNHIKTHPFMQKMKKMKDLLTVKGIEELNSIKTDPIKYFHSPLDSKKCNFCQGDKIYDTVDKISYHRKVCRMNPDPPYPCTVCDDRLSSLLDRNFRYVCHFCPKSYPKKYTRDRHSKTCKDNPKPEYKECPKCGKKCTRLGPNNHTCKK